MENLIDWQIAVLIWTTLCASVFVASAAFINHKLTNERFLLHSELKEKERMLLQKIEATLEQATHEVESRARVERVLISDLNTNGPIRKAIQDHTKVRAKAHKVC